MTEKPFDFEPEASPEPMPHIIFEQATLDKAVADNLADEQEFDALEKLVKRAQEAGVLIECVSWYVTERLRGATPREAASDALYECDC